ncbi:MAG: translation initiation factor [Chloroflexi bacterium]|nr:translation initiation factor [Chloroflexota bacterium]
MPSKNTRLVYSTDPDWEPEPKRKAQPQPSKKKNEQVRVFLDRKGRRGKSVSVIKGIQSHPDGKKKLCKTLKGKLGTGGAVKDGNIEIQGDHRDRIVTLLKEMGYQAKKAGG